MSLAVLPGRMAVLLCLCLINLPVVQSAAQEADTVETREVELLSVDVLEGTVQEGIRVNRLTNARLRQGTTYLESDRATEFIDAREYQFDGNVVIIDEGDTLWADHVRYDSRQKLGRARGNVRLADGDIQVFAPSGRYFVDEKRAEFDEGVRLVDSTAVITSRRGAYWSEEDRGAFADSVILREGLTFMSTDSLAVFRESRESEAHGDVFMRRFGREETADAEADTSVVTYLLGDQAFHDDDSDSSFVQGDPVVLQIRRDTTASSADTTVVRAERIAVARRDSIDRLTGMDTVRVWQGALAAVGDSIHYERRPVHDATFVEELVLIGDPLAWFEQSQVSGDTLRFVRGSAPVDTLTVWGGAFVAQEDTALQRINQLSGRRMTGLFRDDSLRTLAVGPNARAIRYLAGEDGRLSWAVQSSGDEVVIRIQNEDEADVTFGSDTEGRAYPPELIPDSFTLEGYRWEPERRPVLEQLVDLDRVRRRAVRADAPEPPDVLTNAR